MLCTFISRLFIDCVTSSGITVLFLPISGESVETTWILPDWYYCCTWIGGSPDLVTGNSQNNDFIILAHNNEKLVRVYAN